jgi:hypothetical protein
VKKAPPAPSKALCAARATGSRDSITPPPNEFFVKAAVVPRSCLLKTTSLPGATHSCNPTTTTFPAASTKPQKCVPFHPSVASSRRFHSEPLQKAPPPLRKANVGCPVAISSSSHLIYTSHNMAQAAVPTFKLVLVGDGGTGKVSLLLLSLSAPDIATLLARTAGSRVGTDFVGPY